MKLLHAKREEYGNTFLGRRPVQEELEMVPYTYTFCRQCNGRVELGRVAFGAKIICSHCGLEFVIPHPSHASDVAGQGRGGQDRADFPDETPPAWAPIRRGMSLRVFLSGALSFLVRPAAIGRTFALCSISVAAFAAVRVVAYCIGADNDAVDRSTRVLLWNGLLFSTATGAVVLPIWVWVASAYGMTILRETSCGIDAVKDWPRVLTVEGLGEISFIATGVILALLPGVLLSPLWNRLEVPTPWGVGVCAMLLFPMILLSMLEANSPTHCASWDMWKSLILGWRAWLLFHLTTFAAALALVGLGSIVLPRIGRAWGVVVVGVVAALAWMVYFRLLGRLAWFGTHPAVELDDKN